MQWEGLCGGRGYVVGRTMLWRGYVVGGAIWWEELHGGK
jgi:hypothetical protein